MKNLKHVKEEAARCLLCHQAPCSKACKNGDPARALRAKCVGCHLCRLVCPMGAIGLSKRIKNL